MYRARVAMRGIGSIVVIGTGLAALLGGGGCSSAPDEATAQSGAQAVTASNLCQSAMQEVNTSCPGTSQQQWQNDENVASGAVACASCAGSIPGILTGAGAVLAAIACDDCAQAIQKADACAVALSHLAECTGACGHAATGASVCGNSTEDYGLAFYKCGGGYPVIEGACKSGQFCDPHQTFQFGVIDPAQCGDCDNDHGQAPHSSYHNGSGYCMAGTGNAPGWHECISNNGGPGGHWMFLPQLNNQNNCHPTTPPPPQPKCSSTEEYDSKYNGNYFWTCDLNGDGSRFKCDSAGNKSTSACTGGSHCTSGGIGYDDYCLAPQNQCSSQEMYDSQYGSNFYWTCDLNGDGNAFKCDSAGTKSTESCIHGCISSGVGQDDQCVNTCPNCK